MMTATQIIFKKFSFIISNFSDKKDFENFPLFQKIHNFSKKRAFWRPKGPIISEDICGSFQLPKKYSVFLSLACWRLSFEFSRAFLESVSKSWGFQLSPRGLNSHFQWIWQMICLICWWNYQKCTHYVVIHNNTFSNFKFWIVQDRNLEYFLGYMKNDSHLLKESHL